MNQLVTFWNNLPKELKVSCYVVASAAVAELIKYLSGVSANDALMMGLVNIAIVALVELKKRIDVNK